MGRMAELAQDQEEAQRQAEYDDCCCCEWQENLSGNHYGEVKGFKADPRALVETEAGTELPAKPF